MRPTLLASCSLAALLMGSANSWADGQAARYPIEAVGPVTPFTQQDPAYRDSQDHLAHALILLQKAQAEAKASQQSWAFPGFRYDLLEKDLDHVQGQLDILLLPQERRLRYQQLTPDADYFKPEAVQRALDPSPSIPSIMPTDQNAAPPAVLSPSGSDTSTPNMKLVMPAIPVTPVGPASTAAAPAPATKASDFPVVPPASTSSDHVIKR
jgi:hypothetical protein